MITDCTKLAIASQGSVHLNSILRYDINQEVLYQDVKSNATFMIVRCSGWSLQSKYDSIDAYWMETSAI